MGELPEDPVELGNPLGQGIDGRLEMGRQLRPDPVDISTERREMLQGAVVQVEPEPREPSLTCAHEQPLSLRASLEQEVALGNGADRARGLFEERFDVSAAHADDKCRPRPLPPAYGGTDDQASLGLSPFENLSRDDAESPGRGGLALGEQADRCLVRLTEPEGSLDGRRQCDEHGELDLERRQRGELEELRCPQATAEELHRHLLRREAQRVADVLEERADVTRAPGPFHRERDEDVARERHSDRLGHPPGGVSEAISACPGGFDPRPRPLVEEMAPEGTFDRAQVAMHRAPGSGARCMPAEPLP